MKDDLISRQTLRDAIYHAAFETDTEMQKWDSGCWIRYKLIENVIDNLPSAQPEIIRCEECDYWDVSWQNDDMPNCHYCALIDALRPRNFYCAYAERKGETVCY